MGNVFMLLLIRMSSEVLLILHVFLVGGSFINLLSPKLLQVARDFHGFSESILGAISQSLFFRIACWNALINYERYPTPPQLGKILNLFQVHFDLGVNGIEL